MVKRTFSQRFRGTTSTTFPQDQISIFLSDQRLLYVVADHLGQAHFLCDYQDPEVASSLDLLKSVFSLDETFRKAYAQGQLIICKAHALLRPSSSTTIEDKNFEWTGAFLKDDQSKELLSDLVTEPGIQVEYQISSELKTYALQMFPNIRIQHVHTSLIQAILRRPDHHQGSQVFAYIANRRLSLIYIKDGHLQFVNQYETNSQGDILYYTLLVYDQFELDENEVSLSIATAGQVDPKAIDLLNGYIKKVRRMTSSSSDSAGGIHKNESTFENYFLPLSVSKLFSLSNS